MPEPRESLGTTTEEKPQLATQFSGAPGDLYADLALLAKEKGEVAPAASSPETVSDSAASVPEKTKVEHPRPDVTDKATATGDVKVPEKFQAPDGSLDSAKLEKSTINAEEALAKYAEKEKALRQKMSEVHRLSQQPLQPQPPAANAVPLTAFEIQVANDLINEARAFGYDMPQGQAIAQARVQIKMAEARHSAEASMTEGLRIKLEDQERRQELESIAKYDPSVLSPEGIEALSRIRESRPWINNSPKPWSEAYDYYLAEQTKAARSKGQVLPTPTGSTAKAPPTPVGPAPRAVVQSSGPNLQNKADIDKHLNGMNAEEMAKFFKSKGLRW